jgi:hypothetical protein
MPDNETLQYKLQTIFDETGTKQAAAGMKDVGAAGTQATAGVGQLGDAVEGTAKKSEFLGLKTGELKRLTRELGHEFPLAGMAARAMINPIVGAFTAAIAIFGYAKQKLEEWNKALDESAARNAGKDFLPGIEAKAKSLNEAAGASAAYHESLKQIGAGEDEFSTKVKLAIDKLHEFIAAQTEVRNAAEANEIARVNLAEKQGKISGSQGIVQRAGIQERYRKMGEAQQTQGENAELGLKQKELAHDKAQAQDLEADYMKKKAAADKLRAAQAEGAGDLPNAQKAREEAEKELKVVQAKATAARETATRAQRTTAGLGPGFGGSQGDAAAEQNARAAEEAARLAEQDLNRARNREAQDKRAIDEIPVQGAPIFAAERTAAQKATNNSQRIPELEQQVTLLQETLPMRQNARAMASGLKSSTAAMNTEGALVDKVNQGGEKEAQLSEHVTQSIESGSALKVSMIEALKKQKKDNEETKAILDEYAAAIERLNNIRKSSVPGSL